VTGDPLAFPEAPGPRAIWVFTADLDDDAFTRFSQPVEPWPLAEALGVPGLDPAQVETFFAEDIADYGLARYLAQAHGMDAPEVEADADWLDALTGPVILVFSKGLPPGPGRFAPRAPLQFLGRYDQGEHLVPSRPMQPGPSTEGHIPPPAAALPDPARLRRMLAITLAALIALAALVWALA
jgi:hypothetical protein